MTIYKPVTTQPPLPLPPTSSRDVQGMLNWSSDLSRQLYSYLSDLAREANAAIKTDDPLTDDQQNTLETLYSLSSEQLATLTALWGLTTDQATRLQTLAGMTADEATDLIGIASANHGNIGAYQQQTTDLTAILGNNAGNTGKFWQQSDLPYEEGTWTPEVTFDTPGNLSVAYAGQQGIWRKIGSIFFAYVTVTYTPTYTTASGALRISLPAIDFSWVIGNGSGFFRRNDLASATQFSALHTQFNLGYVNVMHLAPSPTAFGTSESPSGTAKTIIFEAIGI